MSAPDGPLLVLGIGNVLLRDEGIGVLVIRELEARVAAGDVDLPPDTRLLDGGTLGLDLLPVISDARALVLVDAIDLHLDPGTVGVIEGEAIHTALAGHVSPHQVGVGDLVGAARLLGTLPPAVALVGIQPLAIEVGLEPSPPVLAALPRAVSAVVEEARRAHRLVADPGPIDRAVPTPFDGPIGTRSAAEAVVPSG